MNAGIVIVVLLVAVLGTVFQIARHSTPPSRRATAAHRAAARARIRALAAGLAELTPTSDMSRRIFGEARQRYTTAGEHLDHGCSAAHYAQVDRTALEGLYYVRAARAALGLDPGPALPGLPGQAEAGSVSESRMITVDGHPYAASPDPSPRTPCYFPGGTVAGRPVPQGWYSEAWWQSAQRTGAWGVGSMFLFSELFSRIPQPRAPLSHLRDTGR